MPANYFKSKADDCFLAFCENRLKQCATDVGGDKTTVQWRRQQPANCMESLIWPISLAIASMYQIVWNGRDHGHKTENKGNTVAGIFSNGLNKFSNEWCILCYSKRTTLFAIFLFGNVNKHTEIKPSSSSSFSHRMHKFCSRRWFLFFSCEQFNVVVRRPAKRTQTTQYHSIEYSNIQIRIDDTRYSANNGKSD